MFPSGGFIRCCSGLAKTLVKNEGSIFSFEWGSLLNGCLIGVTLLPFSSFYFIFIILSLFFFSFFFFKWEGKLVTVAHAVAVCFLVGCGSPLFPARSTSNRILRQISDTCKRQNNAVVQMTVTLYLLFSTILESSLIISDSSQLGSWQFLTGSKTKRTQLVFCWTSVMGGSRFYFLSECISYARTCFNKKRRREKKEKILS